MAPYNFAYTVPFPSNTKITKEQAFEALRVKCRKPMKFVPVIVECEVLEETPTYMKRKAKMNTGMVMIEEMELYAPSLVTFKSENGPFVTNLISETEDGKMWLTFTFSFPLPPDIAPGSEEEVAKKKEIFNMSKGAVSGSLKATLEMFEAGELN